MRRRIGRIGTSLSGPPQGRDEYGHNAAFFHRLAGRGGWFCRYCWLDVVVGLGPRNSRIAKPCQIKTPAGLHPTGVAGLFGTVGQLVAGRNDDYQSA
jgi:hypothetical protein